MTTQFPIRISLQEALAILERVAAESPLPVQRMALARVLGRVLAEDVRSALDLPGFDNSAMDGFALRSADSGDAATLDIVGEQFAGRTGSLAVGAGQCIRITTGAALPAGADAVVMKEAVDAQRGTIRLRHAVAPGLNIRRAGEDVKAGQLVLHSGSILRPAGISLAAALGLHELPVRRRPTVAVFTSGDEIKPPGMPLAHGEIYDSNRALLQSLLLADGYEPVAWPVLPDDPARIESALRDAAFSFDLVITCGGVSVGERDFLPSLLADAGQVYFWKVRMRPGMPVLAGRLGDAQILCLPGNPVSVLATYLALARPFLDRLQARTEPRPRRFARLASAVKKDHDRLEYLRGNLTCDESGQLLVETSPADGSHRLRAASDATALAIFPEGAGEWGVGSVVEVLPLVSA